MKEIKFLTIIYLLIYIIYEELGKPYDYLDDIQISNMFKDRLDNDISNIKD